MKPLRLAVTLPVPVVMMYVTISAFPQQGILSAIRLGFWRTPWFRATLPDACRGNKRLQRLGEDPL
jgi:hypothetical protein